MEEWETDKPEAIAEDWKQVQIIFRSGQPLTAKVVGFNNKGVLVSVRRLRGFIPIAELEGIAPELSKKELKKEFAKLMGENLSMVAIEVDPTRKRLVLSQKKAGISQENYSLGTISKSIQEAVAHVVKMERIKGKVLFRTGNKYEWRSTVIDNRNTEERNIGIKKSLDEAQKYNLIETARITSAVFHSLLKYRDSLQILLFNDTQEIAVGFTPDYLSSTVIPLIEALIQLQHVIDDIHDRPPTDIRILGIRYGSIAVDVSAGLRESIELALEYIIPWQRKNKRRLKELEVAEKEIAIKKMAAEVEVTQVTLASEAEQTEDKQRLLAEDVRQRELENDKLQLENQKMQLELMQLTLAMLKEIKPDLTEEQRLFYAMKMINPVRQIATSPLEIVSVEEFIEDGEE